MTARTAACECVSAGGHPGRSGVCVAPSDAVTRYNYVMPLAYALVVVTSLCGAALATYLLGQTWEYLRQ